VAVSGKAVKRVRACRALNGLTSSTYTPGRPVAGRNGNCVVDEHFLILYPDGTEIGTIMTGGFGASVPPPGAGELLPMSVTGLGPTNPGLDPGKPPESLRSHKNNSF